MAIIGKFKKTAAERKRYTIDYTDWLDEGETVSSIVFGTSPMDTNPAQVDTASIVGGATVQIFISGGISTTAYTIDAKMMTSMGQTKEDTILISCYG